MRTIASASDVQILQAYADQDRLAILQRLHESPATQKQLCASLDLPSGTVSRHMRELEIARLVVHERSHSPYELVEPALVWALLAATSNLSRAVAEIVLGAVTERNEEIHGTRSAGDVRNDLENDA
jgi:DNA-binding IclR family transcriptional regulator